MSSNTFLKTLNNVGDQYLVSTSPVLTPFQPPKQILSGLPNIITPSKTLVCDTVVVSDIHLGSQVSRRVELLDAIKKWYPFRRLVILGDLFENLDFSRLNQTDFEVLDVLKELSHRPDVEVDWIEGNHDECAHSLIERLIGCNTHDEMVLDLYDKGYLLMHGHQFDQFLQKHPKIGLIAGNIYNAVQVREGQQRRLSRWLKKKSKKWLKVCQKVERLAINHAESYGVDFILCGHTHYFDAELSSPHAPIRYINTGCWTDNPCTLTTICHEHGLRQHSVY